MEQYTIDRKNDMCIMNNINTIEHFLGIYMFNHLKDFLVKHKINKIKVGDRIFKNYYSLLSELETKHIVPIVYEDDLYKYERFCDTKYLRIKVKDVNYDNYRRILLNIKRLFNTYEKDHLINIIFEKNSYVEYTHFKNTIRSHHRYFDKFGERIKRKNFCYVNDTYI